MRKGRKEKTVPGMGEEDREEEMKRARTRMRELGRWKGMGCLKDTKINGDVMREGKRKRSTKKESERKERSCEKDLKERKES